MQFRMLDLGFGIWDWALSSGAGGGGRRGCGSRGLEKVRQLCQEVELAREVGKAGKGYLITPLNLALSHTGCLAAERARSDTRSGVKVGILRYPTLSYTILP